MISVSSSLPYPAPGAIIDGRYRCERLIGEGGMGAVVQATHILRRASVALKFMNPEIAMRESYVERFINEAVAASRIDSEHVVKVFDVGQLEDGTPYLVMEYLDGRDLADIIEKQGQTGVPCIARCLHFVVQALSGLQQAHDAGIIHRDMKPSNCFVVDKDGDEDFIKLLDFGISKIHDPMDIKLTQTNSLLGTPLYMSPEQSRSAKLATPRSDLYSMGVILYELLTGRPPFNSDSSFADLLIRIATTDPIDVSDLRPEVPPELSRVVRQSFARDPEERFGSATEMIEALVPWCDERSASVIERTRRRAGGTLSSIPSIAASSYTNPSSLSSTVDSTDTVVRSTNPSGTLVEQGGIPPSPPPVRISRADSVAIEVSSEEPTATPLPVTRARSTYVRVGVAATVVIAAIIGGLLLTREPPSEQDTPGASGSAEVSTASDSTAQTNSDQPSTPDPQFSHPPQPASQTTPSASPHVPNVADDGPSVALIPATPDPVPNAARAPKRPQVNPPAPQPTPSVTTPASTTPRPSTPPNLSNITAAD